MFDNDAVWKVVDGLIIGEGVDTYQPDLTRKGLFIVSDLVFGRTGKTLVTRNTGIQRAYTCGMTLGYKILNNTDHVVKYHCIQIGDATTAYSLKYTVHEAKPHDIFIYNKGCIEIDSQAGFMFEYDDELVDFVIKTNVEHKQFLCRTIKNRSNTMIKSEQMLDTHNIPKPEYDFVNIFGNLIQASIKFIVSGRVMNGSSVIGYYIEGTVMREHTAAAVTVEEFIQLCLNKYVKNCAAVKDNDKYILKGIDTNLNSLPRRNMREEMKRLTQC